MNPKQHRKEAEDGPLHGPVVQEPGSFDEKEGGGYAMKRDLPYDPTFRRLLLLASGFIYGLCSSAAGEQYATDQAYAAANFFRYEGPDADKYIEGYGIGYTMYADPSAGLRRAREYVEAYYRYSGRYTGAGVHGAD